jgi:hypothetical protein
MPGFLARSRGTNEMPPTSGAEKYKTLLGVIGVVAIAVIALSSQALISRMVDLSLEPTRRGWVSLGGNVITILIGAILLWAAYRGRRRNLMPPAWAMLAVVLLSWAGIILHRVF